MTNASGNVKPLPILLAVLVCDVAVAEPVTGKKSLIGVFDKVFVGSFPAVRPMSVYVKLSDAQGKYELAIQFVYSNTGEKIGEAKGTFSATNPLEAADAHVQFPPLPIALPGRYEFRVLADSVYLGSAVIDAVEAPPSPEEKA